MKRSLAILISLCILLSIAIPAFTVSAATNKTADKATSWKKDTSPITFDYFINENWYGQKWGNDSVSKYITEKTGVKLNIITPTSSGNDKLNVMIASGSVPDFVCSNSSNDGVLKLEASGLVYSLNELANKYAPDFFKVAPNSTIKWWTREDGKIYGYPNFSYAPEQMTSTTKVPSNETFLVKKDMYEALGKPDMSTPTGFLNALIAAKKKFPTVNGKPLIPFGNCQFSETGSWGFDQYIQDLLAVPYEKNGKFYDRNTDPEYLRWMKTFRQANQLGLISKDIFIDQKAQIQEKAAQGRYFSLEYQYVDIAEAQQTLFKKDPNSVYIAVKGPTNSRKQAATVRGGDLSGWELNYISKSCKNPARAMQFLTYCVSKEGAQDFYLGKEGDTWTMVNGKPTFKKEVLDAFYGDTSKMNTTYGVCDTYWMFLNIPIVSQWTPDYKEPVKQPTEFTYNLPKLAPVYVNLDPPSDSPEGIINSKIGTLWGQTQTKLLLAKSDADFDKILKDFVDKRASYGFSKVVDYKTDRIQQNKKRAGLN